MILLMRRRISMDNKKHLLERIIGLCESILNSKVDNKELNEDAVNAMLSDAVSNLTAVNRMYQRCNAKNNVAPTDEDCC